MGENIWVWQQKKWPNFYWDEALIQPQLRHARFKLGQLLGETGRIPRQKTRPKH